MQRILEIVRSWQSSTVWLALKQAIDDGQRDDLPNEQRQMDHVLFRAWSMQANEVREYLRENSPTLLTLLPPVNWSSDLPRCGIDDLARNMVKLEGELLAIKAAESQPAGKIETAAATVDDPKVNATEADIEPSTTIDGLNEWVESRLKGGQKKLATKIIGGVTSISALDDLELLGSSSREYPSAKYQDRVRHINDKLRADGKPWKFVADDNEAKVVESDWNSESSVKVR